MLLVSLNEFQIPRQKRSRMTLIIIMQHSLMTVQPERNNCIGGYMRYILHLHPISSFYHSLCMRLVLIS